VSERGCGSSASGGRCARVDFVVRSFSALAALAFWTSIACGRIGYDGQSPIGNDADVAPVDAANNPEADAQSFSNILLAAGWEHTCAAIEGRVACWGQGDEGQLGQGDREPSATPLAVNLPGPATALSSARFHSCALVAGDVYCWGAGNNGLLGTGNTDDSLVPVPVENLPSQVDSVVASADRSCALAAGTAYCWGHDHAGDLGTPGSGGWVAETVTTVSGLSQLSLALSVSCGLVSGGVKCWGKGAKGQLGDGLFSDNRSAVQVVGLGQNVSAIHVAGGMDDVGEIDTSCGIQDGSVQCWGSNDYGQVGDQSTITRGTPVPVVGLRGPARKVNGGTAHFCAVTEPNNIECWGRGDNGQLGAGVFQNSATPVLVSAW
jgi:alpha-tubulin suppressor-like RCC1 family protein